MDTGRRFATPGNSGPVALLSRVQTKLTDRDTIVLADFANTSGDPVFDDALRQGLASQLEQSPFLHLLSDERIAQTLSLMSQPRNSRLTPELGLEVCQRTGSTAVLDGTITQLGTQYLLTLKAINCANGESLGRTEARATDKDQVLDALGKLATRSATNWASPWPRCRNMMRLQKM